MSKSKSIDCRGLACPQPVIDTKSALEGAASPFVVIVDNQGSATNVRRFAENSGARVTVEEKSGDFHLSIEPGEGGVAGEEPTTVLCNDSAGSTVVYVASEGMGRGDDELGAVLMEAFLDTLSHFKGKISHAIFVNAGAKLAIRSSPVLGKLLQLEELGVQVLVCGACLNHFGISEQLGVGTVSNMYAIIETLSSAGRIIRP